MHKRVLESKRQSYRYRIAPHQPAWFVPRLPFFCAGFRGHQALIRPAHVSSFFTRLQKDRAQKPPLAAI